MIWYARNSFTICHLFSSSLSCAPSISGWNEQELRKHAAKKTMEVGVFLDWTKGNERGTAKRDIRQCSNPWLLESIPLSAVYIAGQYGSLVVWFVHSHSFGKFENISVWKNTPLGLKTRVFPTWSWTDWGAETMVESWLALWRLVFFFVRMKLELWRLGASLRP